MSLSRPVYLTSWGQEALYFPPSRTPQWLGGWGACYVAITPLEESSIALIFRVNLNNGGPVIVSEGIRVKRWVNHEMGGAAIM